MERRHRDALQDKIDQLAIHGFAILDKAEWRHRLGATRFSKNDWRAIFDMTSPDEEFREDLVVFDRNDTIIILRREFLKRPGDLYD